MNRVVVKYVIAFKGYIRSINSYGKVSVLMLLFLVEGQRMEIANILSARKDHEDLIYIEESLRIIITVS